MKLYLMRTGCETINLIEMFKKLCSVIGFIARGELFDSINIIFVIQRTMAHSLMQNQKLGNATHHRQANFMKSLCNEV
jgi:hypothetical protein